MYHCVSRLQLRFRPLPVLIFSFQRIVVNWLKGFYVLFQVSLKIFRKSNPLIRNLPLKFHMNSVTRPILAAFIVVFRSRVSLKLSPVSVHSYFLYKISLFLFGGKLNFQNWKNEGSVQYTMLYFLFSLKLLMTSRPFLCDVKNNFQILREFLGTICILASSVLYFERLITDHSGLVILYLIFQLKIISTISILIQKY